MEVPLLVPLYVTFLLLAVIIYLIGAFILGVVSAGFTLPVLYYTGYGLLPPQLTPANTNTELPAAIPIHLGFGGLFAVFSLIATVVTRRVIPPLVQYQFARISPRMESVPKLAVATGIVLVIWIGYLLYAHRGFDGDSHNEQRTGLLASIITAIVFCLCSISIAVLSTATLYV